MEFSFYKRIIVFLLLAGAMSAFASEARASGPPPPLENRSITWMQWGQGAFDSAKASDKLIYLDVSATWCRWCKTMDEETYKDPQVIELINRDFVPVRVDSDDRPDISDRYNQGGWPSIALLTPTGRVVVGRTYLAPIELLAILDAARQAYVTDREKIIQKIAAAEKTAREVKEEREKKQDAVPLSADMPYRVLSSVNLFVDSKYGGYVYGDSEKFPMADVLEFGLYVYPKVKDFKEQSPEKAVELTLKGMAGGLQDKEEGGFYRYSTSIDWKSPHYEKLLTVNGDLLGVYMQASQLFDTSRYSKVGESVAGYLEKTLYDKSTGAFFNSQAADESYFKKDKDDRRDYRIPPVDHAIYADSNARAAEGYLQAYRATGEERYLNTALGVVDYISSVLYKKGRGVLHKGASGDVLLLSDHVYAALAAEQAYQATGRAKYLEFAMEAAGLAVKLFWDAEKGGFYDVAYEFDPIGLLSDRKKPQTENARAAVLLMDLYHITGQEVYKQTARHALAPFTQDYAKYSFWAAPFAQAVERCIEPTYEFIVVGKLGDKDTAELLKKSFTFEDPDRVVVLVDPDRDKKRLEDLGYEPGPTPKLYVCSEKNCFPPVLPGDSMKKVRGYIRKAREQEKK